jgi:hypothetical protein
LIVVPGATRWWSWARCTGSAGDPVDERDRHRDHGALGADIDRVGLDQDAAVVLADPPRRSVQQQAVGAEPGGETGRDRVGAADEAAFLGAAVGLGQERQRAGRADVDEDVEQRELVGLGGEDGGDHLPQQRRRFLVLDGDGEPARQGLAVPLERPRRGPRLLERQFGGHPVELPDHVGELQQGDVLAAVDQDVVLALVVGREGLDPQLGGEGDDPVLGRADELTAELGDGTANRLLVADPAADPLAGLDDDDVAAGALDLVRRGEAGEPGTDHDHVGVERGTAWGGLHV